MPISPHSLIPRNAQMKAGFTLIELLVVIAVLAMLVSLLIPAVQAARKAARRSQCANNLRQVGLAVLNFEGSQGAIPGAHDANLWSWLTKILPHLEHAPLYDQFDFHRFALPRKADSNTPLSATVLAVLNCSSDNTSSGISREVMPGMQFAYTSYLGVAGTHLGWPVDEYRADGMFPSTVPYVQFPPAARPLALRRVTDGTSNTLLVGERPVISFFEKGFGDSGWWATGHGHPPLMGRADYVLDSSDGLRPGTDSSSSYDDAFHWWSYHPGGAQFTFADGSTRMLSYGIDHNILLGLSSRNGSEVLVDRE